MPSLHTMIDRSCMVVQQDQWLFCPGMFWTGIVSCIVVIVPAYLALWPWLRSRKLTSIDVEDASIRVVSVVHALFVAGMFSHALLTERLPTAFTSQYRCATFTLSASLGYFLFDVLAILHLEWRKGRTWKSEASMLAHHVFAAGGELATLNWAIGGQLVGCLMLSEFTTPMLHFIYVLERANYLGNNRPTRLLCGAFVVQWLIFRIGVSMYFFIHGLLNWQAVLDLGIAEKVLWVTVTIFFNFINAFWLMKIIKKGKRMAIKSKHSKKSE